MQAISRFVRTTIFGGVLFLTPIVVIWFILSKAYNLAGRVLLPSPRWSRIASRRERQSPPSSKFC